MLSPNAMSLAQKAALHHIKMSGETESRIGVFATEPQVRVLQRYTTEPALVRKAVQQLITGGDQGREARAEQIEQLRERRRAMQAAGLSMDPGNNTQAGQGQNVALIGQAEVERRLMQGEMRMLQAFENLDRDHRGYGITNALLAISETMAFLPGRKSIVYFSEGLPASPAMQAQLQSVIEAANRSNITVYAVDATGLRVHSSTTETRREVQAAGEERLREASSGLDRTDGPLTRVLERTEDLMRYQNETGLARLAEDTGGFLVQGTNDIGSGFTAHRRGHAHSLPPHLRAEERRARRQVPVDRREGEAAEHHGVRPQRLPGRASAHRPRADLRSAGARDARHEPAAERLPLEPRRVRVPGSRASRPDADRRARHDRQPGVRDRRGARAYNAQAAVVVRIRDDAGRIVQKLSQQYVLTGRPARSTGRSAARSSSTASPSSIRASTRWSRSCTTRWRRRAA
jgi:VWFA-related protein